MSDYDVIVVGAGHNGLTAAAALAKRGRKVLVLEQRDVPGGFAAQETFHPGYTSPGLLHDTTGVRRSVVEALMLESHGLKLNPHRPDVLALGSDGKTLLLHGEAKEAAATIRNVSDRDGERYLAYHAFLDRLRESLMPVLESGPFDPIDFESNDLVAAAKAGLKVRGLGRKDMMELLRIPPMCVADWLNEWFETELLKAALAQPAIHGTFTGPWSPGSNANLLLAEITAGPGVAAQGATLVAALESCARSHGVELHTGRAVSRIEVERHQVRGVTLAGGERVTAPVVACACDPKRTFLELVSPGAIDFTLEEHIRHLRTRGTTAQVLFALKGAVRFKGAPGPVEFARTGDTLDDLERAFDAVKYRRFSDTPVLDVHVPTISRPELAPQGGSVVSVLAHFAPYDLDPAWDDGQRARFGDAVQAVLEPHMEGWAAVDRRVVRTPLDLESHFGSSGGHIHHGEHSLDQLLVRPSPECVRYETPVHGLFLCGSGSYPGGGLTCAPGALAADRIASGRAVPVPTAS